MAPGEIFLANFPFGDAPVTKLRPVLLLAGPIGPASEVLVACISSILPSSLLSTDLLIDPSSPEHSTTYLKSRSVLRLHKLATLHGRTMARYLGKISPATTAHVQARLRMLLNL